MLFICCCLRENNEGKKYVSREISDMIILPSDAQNPWKINYLFFGLKTQFWNWFFLHLHGFFQHLYKMLYFQKNPCETKVPLKRWCKCWWGMKMEVHGWSFVEVRVWEQRWLGVGGGLWHVYFLIVIATTLLSVVVNKYCHRDLLLILFLIIMIATALFCVVVNKYCHRDPILIFFLIIMNLLLRLH